MSVHRLPSSARSCFSRYSITCIASTHHKNEQTEDRSPLVCRSAPRSTPQTPRTQLRTTEPNEFTATIKVSRPGLVTLDVMRSSVARKRSARNSDLCSFVSCTTMRVSIDRICACPAFVTLWSVISIANLFVNAVLLAGALECGNALHRRHRLLELANVLFMWHALEAASKVS